MTKQRAAEILEAHNKRRRDGNVPNSKPAQNPAEIGKAIDVAVAELRKTPVFDRCECADEHPIEPVKVCTGCNGYIE